MEAFLCNCSLQTISDIHKAAELHMIPTLQSVRGHTCKNNNNIKNNKNQNKTWTHSENKHHKVITTQSVFKKQKKKKKAKTHE